MNPSKVTIAGWILIAAALFNGCAKSQEDLSAALIASDDVEESAFLVRKASRSGADAVPILLTVLNRNVSNKYSALEREKTNLCLKALHDLVAKGEPRVEAVPVLLKVIKEQIAIEDTLVTAETLRLITGLNTGYTKDFVGAYQEKDESERLRKVQVWEEWLRKKQGA